MIDQGPGLIDKRLNEADAPDSISQSKANVVQIGSEGERAYERVRPLLEKLKDDIRAAADAVSKEYDKLPKLEKAVFAARVKEEYGWSRDRLSTFARIGREFPEKKKIISSSNSTAKIDETSTIVMEEIVRTSDKSLRIAADAGLFENKVTGEVIRRFRRTGQLPREKSPSKTGIAAAQDDLEKAYEKLKGAAVNLHSLVYFMQKHNATQASGLDAFKLVSAIEGIADAISEFDVETRTRAIEIIQGKRERGLPLPKFGVRPAKGAR